MRVRSALLTDFDAELDRLGVTGAQFAVLKYLTDSAAVTAADLCRAMHYDTGSMTRMLDRLEDKRLIRRERCTDDRRVIYLRLTQTGTYLLPELRSAALRVIARHLAGFAAQDLDSLKQFLERMIQNGRP